MLDLLAKGEITGKMAKDLFELMWTTGEDPADLAAKQQRLF